MESFLCRRFLWIQLCPSVCNAFFSGLAHYFFLTYFLKLRFNKLGIVLEPFFEKNFFFYPKWCKWAIFGLRINSSEVWNWKLGLSDRFAFLRKDFIMPKMRETVHFWTFLNLGFSEILKFLMTVLGPILIKIFMMLKMGYMRHFWAQNHYF